jgi:hypothetical protein|tara:strand:- start:7494 stop:7958 length:465 start_codon:yes stop_codon:yes gene_type:complete
MILISHRGNINGRNESRENSIEYIYEALNEGYDVEIDVWYKGGEWFLGHDGPENYVVLGFLKNDKLWCHAKNIDALNEMLKEEIHCFWHQDDDVVLTSCGFIWTSPGKQLTSKSIVVLPELNNGNNITMLPKNILGICSDFIVNYNIVNKGVEE